MPSKKKKSYKYLQHLLCQNIVGIIEGTKKKKNYIPDRTDYGIYIIGQQNV